MRRVRTDKTSNTGSTKSRAPVMNNRGLFIFRVFTVYKFSQLGKFVYKILKLLNIKNFSRYGSALFCIQIFYNSDFQRHDCEWAVAHFAVSPNQ